MADDIENAFKYLINQGHRNLTLHVHPILEAYLTKGSILKPSIAKKWMKANKVKMKIQADNNAPLTEFHFYDTLTDDIIKL